MDDGDEEAELDNFEIAMFRTRFDCWVVPYSLNPGHIDRAVIYNPPDGLPHGPLPRREAGWYVWDEQGELFTPDEARQLAAYYLAAADEAERRTRGDGPATAVEPRS